MPSPGNAIPLPMINSCWYSGLRYKLASTRIPGPEGVSRTADSCFMKIIQITVRDVRFPTSRNLDGSDAMDPSPDYSLAYVVIQTDSGLDRRLRYLF